MMFRHLVKQTCRLPLRIRSRPDDLLRRSITNSADYENKYAEKLRQRASETGLTVDALKAKIKEEQAEEARRTRESKAAHATQAAAKTPVSEKSTLVQTNATPPPASVRKDSSPVKPLTSILNLQKLMATPHTPEQISALWTTYHMSRSGGTGRGYVCATVPLDLYRKMAKIAERYSSFIVPVPRMKPTTEPKLEGEEDTAYEFYFLQWDFHDVPPVPTATEDLFAPSKPTSFSAGANPKTSTILFTPLQEYKMRGTFATPYLVLTHYTDLAHSHGVVLLRGEITPASASGGGAGRYMLTQEDAQLLSMAAQKFYLWDSQDEASAGGELLKCFHERPEEFKWEELLKHANLTV